MLQSTNLPATVTVWGAHIARRRHRRRDVLTNLIACVT